MATTKHIFRGIASWAKLQTPDDYLGVQKWKITLAMNEEEITKFRETGSNLAIKDSDDGQTVTFNKKAEKPSWHDEEKWGPWEAPKAYMNGEEFTGLIGNGSEVLVSIDVYDTKLGPKGHRLNYINITKLVDYDPDKVKDNEEGNDTLEGSTVDMAW